MPPNSSQDCVGTSGKTPPGLYWPCAMAAPPCSDTLSDRFSDVFRKIRGRGKITEDNPSLAFALAYPKLTQFVIDDVIGKKRVDLLAPMMLALLAAGQAVVILGGGIDISVGAIVSIINTILATRVGLQGSPEAMWQYVGLSLFVGALAGAINGFFVAYLRLQPIITTYATSFLYAGFALFVLPNPGGGIPAKIADLYRNTSPLGLPLAFYVIAIVLGLWGYIRSTR